jgi:hypothetical protein
MRRRLQCLVLESESLLLAIDVETDLGALGVDDGLFAVLGKGHPKIMGAFTSPPVSITTKSAGI